MKVLIAIAAAAVVATGAAAFAASPLGKPVSGARAKQIMQLRHEGMESIGDAFKVVGRETRSDNPNVGAVRTSAATINRLAQRSAGWFRPGTGPNVGKTRAKAEIWQKPQDFAAKDKAFQQAARAFKAAADSGNMSAIRAQAGALGKACKACHDPYRAPED